MRILISFATLVLMSTTASAQTYSSEPNTYRYGGTYKTVNAGSADGCASVCGQEQACLAWSFQRQTRGAGSAQCELKSTIGRAVTNPLMTSGIKPQIANQGATFRRPAQSSDTLLGGPDTVVRNSTTRVHITAPQPLAPIPAPTPTIRQAPAPTPAFRPTPQPTQSFTPPAAAIAPTPSATLQPAPLSSIAPPAVQAATPAPTSAPIPQAPPVRSQRIQVPVTQGTLPPGSVLRDTPPPSVTFDPPEATPLPPRPPAAVTPKTESVTLPFDSDTNRTAPRTLNTVPAGSIPAPVATPATPYNSLRNQSVPTYSVNNDTVPTPDDLIAADEAARQASGQIIDRVEIDSVDLAEDVGQPIGRDLTEERRRNRLGGGS